MEKICVMMSGLSNISGLGNVARVIAEALEADDRFHLMQHALGGPEISEEFKEGESFAETQIGNKIVKIFSPKGHRDVLGFTKQGFGRNFFIVDFSHPSAVNVNAEIYCELSIPFVMGTTGGDREVLIKTVEQSGNIAVIAPNMAPQIVGFQAMMEYAAKTFPDLFAGYSLQIMESHQASKADTSGTAKAMVKYFNAMGVDFDEGQIKKERNINMQAEEWGVPEKYLSGHGWHTYVLTSPDGKVKFEFTHNVNGRDIYVEGVKKSLFFLEDNNFILPGSIFDMIGVLSTKNQHKIKKESKFVAVNE